MTNSAFDAAEAALVARANLQESHFTQEITCIPYESSEHGNGHIRTVRIQRVGLEEAVHPPLVLIPGFGQGAASFWRNFEDLAQHHPSGTVCAIDWPGCGGSSRPVWDCESPEDAEWWFVDALEAWRVAMQLDVMDLCGHSMGGIISVAYAERYPERLRCLVLASPAGVPCPPEMTLSERFGMLPWYSPQRALGKTITNLWERGVTPQSVVRGSGCWIGKRIVNNYVHRRFEDDLPDKEEFAEYMYQLFQGEPASEAALSAMLFPGAYAKLPLCNRIPELAPSISISFIYGETDWMDIGAAREVMLTALKRTPQRKMTVRQIRDAGHQLFIDNPKAFNDQVIKLTTVDA